MGYDLNLRLDVQPTEHFAAVQSAISEQFGNPFDENGDGEIHGSDWCYDIRWSNLTEDLIALSKGFPDTRITIYAQGDDGQVWMEYFHDGKYRVEIRPEWEEPEWDDDKMGAFPYKPVEDPKKFTVILLYPELMEGEVETWMGEAHGATVEEAIADARRQIMDGGGTADAYEPEDYKVIAVIAGHHEDLNV